MHLPRETWVLKHPNYSNNSKNDDQGTPRTKKNPKEPKRFQKDSKIPKVLRQNPKYFKRIQKTPDDSEKNPKESKKSQRIPIRTNVPQCWMVKKTKILPSYPCLWGIKDLERPRYYIRAKISLILISQLDTEQPNINWYTYKNLVAIRWNL